MPDNYEITKRRVQALFPNYDHAAMAMKFSLKLDESYLYIPMLGAEYRLSRTTGETHSSEDGFVTFSETGFNEVLTLMDVLCDSAPHCRASEEYCSVNDLDGVVVGTGLGSDFYGRDAEYFGANIRSFRRACERLGGIPLPQGDASYQLPLFDFLSIRIMLWEADDEFPVSMKLLFDRNTLDFMRYETTYYAAGHLMKRLRTLMEAE